MTATSPPTVKSAMRTIDILEYVVARPTGVVAQEIAADLGIPVSSLSYLLVTLVERGYLAREGRRYLPGNALARLAGSPPAARHDRRLFAGNDGEGHRRPDRRRSRNRARDTDRRHILAGRSTRCADRRGQAGARAGLRADAAFLRAPA